MSRPRGWKRALRTILGMGLILALIGIVITALPWLSTQNQRQDSVDAVTPARMAIVFGAGYYKDGEEERLYRITAHRVEAAVKLYTAGMVDRILVSGDNSVAQYNEPKAMWNHALELGVPAEALCLDYAGRSTYDTCYRAKHIFGIDQAVMVTQAYHLPRAVYLCEQMGIESQGLEADSATGFEGDYPRGDYYRFRESLAVWKALWEAHIDKREAEIMGPAVDDCAGP